MFLSKEFADELNNYIAEREKEDDSAHKKAKHAFFSSIKKLHDEGRLTVDAVNALLIESTLHENQIRIVKIKNEAQAQAQVVDRSHNITNLFWSVRTQSTAISTRAAQFVQKIYQFLGIPLDEGSLKIIIKKGLTEKQAKNLSLYPYKKWVKEHNGQALKVLEDQLLISFNLSPEKGELPINLLKSSENKLGFLQERFLKIAQDKPAYLTHLLNRLKEITDKDEFAADKQFFLAEVKAFYKSHPSYQQLILKCQPDLLLSIILEDREVFFRLEPLLQDEVLNLLDKRQLYKQKTELVAQLKNNVDNHLLLAKKNGAEKEAFFYFINRLEFRRRTAGTDDQNHCLFKEISNFIATQIQSEVTEAILQDQKIEALQAIQKYLKLSPDLNKQDFFIGLARAIRQEGRIDLALLENHLKDANREALFAKWSGAINSRAAGLIKKLYGIATHGQILSPEAFNQILTTGKVVTTPELMLTQDKLIQDKIALRLCQPHHPVRTKTDQLIQREWRNLRMLNRIEHHHIHAEQEQARVCYQQFLIEKAEMKAQKSRQPIFDTQGHILVELTLTQEDRNEVWEKIVGVRSTKDVTIGQLAAKLGLKHLQENIVCKLDISKNSALKSTSNPLNNLSWVKLLQSQHRHSIIPLQEEMQMHLSLYLRTIDKLLLTQEAIANGQSVFTIKQKDDLIYQLNQMVLKTFFEILQSNDPTNLAVIPKINAALDEARPAIAKKMTTDVRSKILNGLSSEYLQKLKEKLSEPSSINQLFSSTSATAADYLRTDYTQGQSIFVTGTEYTSHQKEFGREQQALQHVWIHRLHSDGYVFPYTRSRAHARVPSLAVLANDDTQASLDVKNKLNHAAAMLRQQNKNAKGVLIYNLLTSLPLHDALPGANNQRRSAACILRGAHLYNQEQFNAGQANFFVLVQNIPVNQHTKQLDANTMDSLVSEASLMTDLALLETLKQYSVHFPKQLREKITVAREQSKIYYHQFLTHGQVEKDFFVESRQGKQCKALMKEYKKECAQLLENIRKQPDNQSFETTVALTLFKLLVSGDYQNPQFGMLTQALSIFLEPLSLAGCKSGNERYQAVSGRVELLQALSETEDTALLTKKQQLISVFDDYLSGKKEAKGIQKILDCLYNATMVYGNSCGFSMRDQGMTTKHHAISSTFMGKGRIFALNTNTLETGYVTNLVQKNTASLQAHKGKLAEKLFDKHFMDELESKCQPIGVSSKTSTR